MRLAVAVLITFPALAGEPRPKAAAYPAQAQLGTLELGAECMVHSFSDGKRTFVADDYLVVEVGIYPGRDQSVLVSSSHFTLRMNGKKSVLYAQTPGMVAASLKYPDWDTQRGLEGTAGAGGVGVILGRPQPVGRFPGDPVERQRRLPQPPRAPAPDSDKEPEPSAEEVAVSAALVEGETRGPVGGYLYFPYKGKMSKVRRLELLYNGPGGSVELRLIK